MQSVVDGQCQRYERPYRATRGSSPDSGRAHTFPSCVASLSFLSPSLVLSLFSLYRCLASFPRNADPIIIRKRNGREKMLAAVDAARRLMAPRFYSDAVRLACVGS